MAVLLASICVLIGLMVMPGSWWNALGMPFTTIQFPYRLAGWLALAMALELAVGLRFARGLAGGRRRIAIALVAALTVVTLVQASAQLYSGPRLDGTVNEGVHANEAAFANGPEEPPEGYYAAANYADASRALLSVPYGRFVLLPTPAPGETRVDAMVSLPPGPDPVAVNVSGGPYVVRIEGLRVVGRTETGAAVVKPPADGRRQVRLSAIADAGAIELVGVALSILCLVGCVALVVVLTVRRRLRYRRAPT